MQQGMKAFMGRSAPPAFDAADLHDLLVVCDFASEFGLDLVDVAALREKAQALLSHHLASPAILPSEGEP